MLLSPVDYPDQWTWLIEKWKQALQRFPQSLIRQGAFGRLVRTTIGNGIARLYRFAENDETEQLDEKLFQALQIGFYFGVAYALVDGFQDQQNKLESIDVNRWLIEIERILSGEKIELTALPQLPITTLMLEAFESLLALTSADAVSEQMSTDLALLLRSQRMDKKEFQRLDYDQVELYLGPLLKSHFTYRTTAVLGGSQLSGDQQRSWKMPFLGQLTDDCRDFDEDRRNDSITPVTYYARYGKKIFNPFLVFLLVCEDLYLENHRNRRVGAFLGRRILRTLKALKETFEEFSNIFIDPSSSDLRKCILSFKPLFDRVSDPDKSIFGLINQYALKHSSTRQTFDAFAYEYLPLIENKLTLPIDGNNPLVAGVNHSLIAGGKRLRPLLLLMMGQLYGIEPKRLLPLARSIEYLHTSSLIFDDLPAQDNAQLRRGQPTLHLPIDSDTVEEIPSTLAEGRAQLVAVNLIAHAIRLVSMDLSLEGFSSERINRVIGELSQSMNELCLGQFLDLQAARTDKSVTLAELDRIAELKTGAAIDIVLRCPMILAGEEEESLVGVRRLGQTMGILFQMKDDLLDVEGEAEELGKCTHIDERNQTMTYIHQLGLQGTRERLETLRKQVESTLTGLWPQAETLLDLIRFICERKK